MTRKKKFRSRNDSTESVSRYRSERFVFIMCIFIATSFWLLIKLSQVYNVNYELNVSYKNPPAGLRLTEVTDTTLSLNVTARGFSILKMNLFEDMDKLDINLDNYSIEEDGGDKYSIYTSELTMNLGQLTGIDENKIKFSKAVLSFKMEKTGVKEVPLIPDFQMNFASQYDLYSQVNISPEKIKIYGPQSALDTIHSVSTEKLILNNVSGDIVERVSVKNPNPSIYSIGDDDVTIYFQVAKFTDSHITVKVNVSNLKYKVQTFPSQVEVYYTVAQMDFNNVRSHQFIVQPVIGDLDIVHAEELPLKLIQQPDFVRNVRIVPAEVEFLIIK